MSHSNQGVAGLQSAPSSGRFRVAPRDRHNDRRHPSELRRYRIVDGVQEEITELKPPRPGETLDDALSRLRIKPWPNSWKSPECAHCGKRRPSIGYYWHVGITRSGVGLCWGEPGEPCLRGYVADHHGEVLPAS